MRHNISSIIFAIVLVLSCTKVVAQSPNYNYRSTYVYKQATSTSDPSKANAAVVYYDGLGRPIQQIAGKASATGKDIVTHIDYDLENNGLRPKSYLPFAGTGTDLNFVLDAKAATEAFYNTEDYEFTANPFSEKVLEASPLQRVQKQAAPGNAWSVASGHTINFTHTVNAANEVKRLSSYASLNAADGLYDASFVSDGYYPEAELYKSVVTDENGRSTYEYKNREGKVVLKRSYNEGAPIDTYYVYDQFGNLSYVLPPLADGNYTAALCYSYRYDRRNRLAEKKLPGKAGPEYIIYDALDRVVATGPAYSPFGSSNNTTIGWLTTYYDIYNRVCITGWYPGTFTATDVMNLRESYNTVTHTGAGNTTVDNVATGYTVNGLPSKFKILTVNYYDNYTWPGAPAAPTASTKVEGQDVALNVKGLLTGSWARVLTLPLDTFAETSYTFYDKKNRPVREHQGNYLGGYTVTDNVLDFDGTLQYSIVRHKRLAADTELVTRHEFTYTAQDRLLTATHQVNNNPPQLMGYNTYNEMGRLTSKKVGGNDVTGSTALQRVDYTYNIRGWLKGINDVEDLTPTGSQSDLFAFKINYNEGITEASGNKGVTALYNGNIAETLWRSGTDNVVRAYGYKYDNLNRLNEALYQKASVVTNSYNEIVNYDKNGNIQTLVRNGDLDNEVFAIEMDNLIYSYDPVNKNQLMRVTDDTNHPGGFSDGYNADDDYSYDNYGNLTSDKNKDISNIKYSHLNVPLEITFNSPDGVNRIIKYIYSATGSKLSKKVTIGTSNTETVYLAGMQYVNGILDFMPTAEGYVKYTAGGKNAPASYNYIYQYKDHLGNVRMNYALNPSHNESVILEESHYYPFGYKHVNYNMNQYMFVGIEGEGYYTAILPRPNGQRNTYQYKYNGKEYQDELGISWYDYGARNYDAAIGRWMNIDPLAEKYLAVSPYVYVVNNPVIFIDPDGMRVAGQWDSNSNDARDNESYDLRNDIFGRKRFNSIGTYISPMDREDNLGNEYLTGHLDELASYGSSEESSLQGDPNLIMAQELAKTYGYKDVQAIREWLADHPFTEKNGIVSFQGIKNISYDINKGNEGLKTDAIRKLKDKIGNKAVTWTFTKALTTILGKGAGQLLTTTSLTNYPPPNRFKSEERAFLINSAQKALLTYMFQPQGPRQTPSMANNMSSYSGYSFYNLYTGNK